MRRGRLIFPSVVRIKQLDTEATGNAGDYDETAGEAILTSTADGLGESALQYKTEIELRAQLEERDFFEQLDQFMQGNAPNTRLHLTFHVDDLERAGLWDEQGSWGTRCRLRVGDRVVSFADVKGRELFAVPENPGLFVTEVRPTGFLETQNLVVCVLSDRSKGEFGTDA